MPAASPIQEIGTASSNNATRHGGTSRKLIVPGEDAAEFGALLAGPVDEYHPDTTQSRIFIENLAEAHWLLARRQRAHSAIESAIYEEQPDEAKWTEQHLKRLALADRYRTQAERSLKRALNNIESWRKWTRGETDRELRHSRWEAEQGIRERRMTLAEEKFRLAQASEGSRIARFAKNAVSSPEEDHLTPVAQAESVKIFPLKAAGIATCCAESNPGSGSAEHIVSIGMPGTRKL